MTYEKAFAETIVFDEQELFAIISSGKLCSFYGKLNNGDTEETCYEVDAGSSDVYGNWNNSICKDVTGLVNPCYVIRCYEVKATIEIVP